MSLYLPKRLTGRLSPIFLIPLWAMLLGACSVLPQRPPQPAVHDFGLAPKAAGAAANWSKATVEAPDWLQTENLRYRLLYSEPTQIRYYAQDRWLAPPPSLFAQRLSLASNGSGLNLKIRLLEFEQDFLEPQNSKVVLAFRAIAQKPETGETVGEKLFRFERPAPSADAKGAVTASARLIEEAADTLARWLAELQTR